jgi:hypothetical protein
MNKKDRILLSIGSLLALILTIAFFLIIGYMNTYTTVNGKVINSNNCLVTVKTVNNQIYSFYTENENDLKESDYVLLKINVHDRTTYTDDEVIDYKLKY